MKYLTAALMIFGALVCLGGDKPLREMIKIPAGSFIMGTKEKLRTGGKTEAARPRHKVYLDSFYMDKYEVTQGDYEKLMGVNPAATKERLELTEKLKDKNFKPTWWYNPVGDNYPVDKITWYDAARYCNARSKAEGLEPCYDEETWECDFSKNGYRLPTEAEWEYACRAGTDTKYFFGDDESQILEYVNCFPEYIDFYNKHFEAADIGEEYIWDKPFPGLLPVGSKKPNNWGLHDMLGNALEWCNDWYDRGYYKISPGKNPRGPEKGDRYKMTRGGAYHSLPVTCAERSGVELEEKWAGFRCVRNAPKDEDVKDDKDKGKKKE